MENLINVYAFSLPIFIFLYWFILGYASLSVLYTQRNTLFNLLLAPSIGLSLNLVCVFLLNYHGIPVIYFAKIMAISLLGLSILILWLKRPLFPIKYYRYFIGAFLLGLIMTGWPLLELGFDWLAYLNEDMTNYCFGAARLLHQGYLEFPDINTITTGKDYSLLYWFLLVGLKSRSGGELILAEVSAMTALSPLQIFMPVIIAVNLALISTFGAMVYTFRPFKQKNLAAFIVCLCLCFSTATTYGVVSQLLGQVAGLCLFSCTMALLMQNFSIHKRFFPIQYGFLISFVFSAFLIQYPELFPFLILSYLLYLIIPTKNIQKIRYFNKWSDLGLMLLVVCAGIILFLSSYLISVIFFLLTQISAVGGSGGSNSWLYFLQGGEDGSRVALLPFSLTPHFLSSLWGLESFQSRLYPPLWGSISIGIGAMLLFIGVVSVAWMIAYFREKASALVFVAAIMIGMCILLYMHGNDYGLFKIAMYFQPFMLGSIILFLFTAIRRRFVLFFLLLPFCILGIPMQYYYTSSSMGNTANGAISYSSNPRIGKEYINLLSKVLPDKKIILTDYNPTLLKYQMLMASGKNLAYCSFPVVFFQIKNSNEMYTYFFPDTAAKVDYLGKIMKSQFKVLQFDLRLENHQNDYDAFDEFSLCDAENENALIVIGSPRHTILNTRMFDVPITNHFSMKLAENVKNLLIIMGSDKGGPIRYEDTRDRQFLVTLYNSESDPFYPGQLMQAIGKNLLFRVINSTQPSRVTLTITSTFNADREAMIPMPVAIGKERVGFTVSGRGSARIFSQPLTVQTINKHGYMALDMQSEGSFFTSSRVGLMKLYGKNVLLDFRKISGFARDISLISEEEYQKMNPPTQINQFPKDLANLDLEYSGIYEDGWISESSFFYLKPKNIKSTLVIKGMLPKIDEDFAGTKLTVFVDDHEIFSQKILPGDIDIKIPITQERIIRNKVSLVFERYQKLPNGDGRVIAMKMDVLGFE